MQLLLYLVLWIVVVSGIVFCLGGPTQKYHHAFQIASGSYRVWILTPKLNVT